MFCIRMLILVLLALPNFLYADYTQHAEAKVFIDEMKTKHAFSDTDLATWFTSAEKKQSILDAISRPAEKAKPWKDYRPIFIQPQRVNWALEFQKKYQSALSRAEKEYGVESEITLAIIGVETGFGRNMGSHRVIDALSTLAFDYPPRSPFFRSELEHYLLLTREQKQDPLSFKGSYAGAMGYGQFMPSSYRNFAVDFDHDQFVDIWNNPVDAIGSVANYFKQHGWQYKKPVVAAANYKAVAGKEALVFNQIQVPAVTYKEWKKSGLKASKLIASKTPLLAIEFDGDKGLEYWLAYKNFYVITRYNRSPMYAMAVYQLSQQIREASAANHK